MTDEHLAGVLRFVAKAYGALERINYYQILNIKADSDARDARAAYYKLAQRLHPDLYGEAVSPEQRRQLTAVYSRVVEAYQVLIDGPKRAQYDERLEAGENRLTADAVRAPKKAPEDALSAGAKKFYLLGVTALRSGDKNTAAMNLKLALSMEPDADVIKDALSKLSEGEP